LQNSSHIAALKNRIKHYEDVPFFSVIVFYGDCDLRSIDYVPKDTYVVKAGRILEVIRIILQEHSPYVYRNETEVVQFLKDSVENGGKLENQVRHIEDVKEMLGTHRVFK